MKTRLKFLLGFFVYSFTILVVLVAGGFWWLSHEFTKPGPLGEASLVTIDQGSGLRSIAETLHKAGAIEREDVFFLSAQILGRASALKAGEYELQPAMSAKDILDMLHAGRTYNRFFTVREGLTSYEIVRLLNNVEGLSGEITTLPTEGSLLPDTYSYRLGENRNVSLGRLKSGMYTLLLTLCHLEINPVERTLESLKNQPCGTEPLKTVGDVLTLASIVEKETGKPEERARVAGVFINRLKRGIPLQTDPSVIYALTKGEHRNEGQGPLGRRLLKKDLEIDSPYNTYKYPGLPPGPITNPGRAALEAVLNPEDHDYLFFVANGTGGHLFAKTLAEHNRNVAKWRKIRKAQEN